MKQYCRYCVNLCVNNVPYCMEKRKVLSKSYCKHTNTCTEYVFANVEAEYQDAFGETDGYKPRVKQSVEKITSDYEQLSFFGGRE